MTDREFVNRKWGRLHPLELLFKDKHYNAFWLVGCQCGNVTITTRQSVVCGNSRSCGCLERELKKKRLQTHGMTGTPIYRAWESMLRRCRNPSQRGYKHYGGRGIEVCKRWLKFEMFFKDMAPTFKSGLTLERREVNKGYSPSNCRWATMAEQQRNRRNNMKWNGETAAEAARRLGAAEHVVHTRVYRGWSLEEAFTRPIKEQH